MAEAKKEAPASAGTKKKSSLLVEEIDEDFLTSWKSIKVAEDADFESGAPPSKTKGFKFGKLDMDFSLDGDFNDLPSFKLDMGDLDFTSPAKKEGNIKERSDKEIAVKSKGKKDLFTLDFNFNESDGFDLDTGFSKGKKSDKSDERDGFSIQEEANKAPRKELASNSDQPKKDLEAVTMLDSGTTLKCINDAGTSNPGKADNAHFSHTENAGENTLTDTPGIKTGSPQQSPSNTLRERTEQRDCTRKVHESFVPETSAESFSGGDKVLITASEVQPPDAELHADVAMRSVTNRKMNNLKSFSGSSASKDCYLRDEKCHNESDSESKEVVESRDLSMTKLSAVNATGQSPEITNTAGKVNRVEKDIPKHDSVAQSSRSSLRRMVSFRGNSSPLGLSKAVDKSQDIRPQHPTLKSLSTLGGKLASIASKPGTKSLAEVSNDASDRRVQVSRIGELKNHLQAQPESDVSSQKTHHKDACTSITRIGNYKSLPIVAAPAQDLVLAAKITPTLTQNFSPIITPTLKQNSSSLSGVHKNLNNTSPDIPAGQCITGRKEAVSAKQPDVRIQLTLNSKMKSIVGSNKIAAVSPSLKRKTLEETNTDSVILNPLKQRRGLSCENREPQVAPEAEMLEKRQESLTKDVAADVLRNYFGDSTSKLHILEANEMNVEVPLLIEKDSNIEKAEACSKELDELCNMLKKKNDEAKEILVRAVVNNNLLLMLNHPMYDEKIQKLQRLLTNLTLAERSF